MLAELNRIPHGGQTRAVGGGLAGSTVIVSLPSVGRTNSRPDAIAEINFITRFYFLSSSSQILKGKFMFLKYMYFFIVEKLKISNIQHLKFQVSKIFLFYP